jgi:hypothetical protein
MAPNTQGHRDVEEAATILLQMAEQEWDAPEFVEDEETETEAIVQDASEPVDERMQGAEILLSFSQAAVVHSTSPSHSVSTPAAPAVPAAPVAPAVPASTPISTRPIRDPSMAALTPQQRTVQQNRKDMTSQQRGALDLKPYAHTKNENRTFRQTQRRKGAARLRAGTTTGLKFPGRRRAWTFVSFIRDILTTKNAFSFVFSSKHLFYFLPSSSSIIVFKPPKYPKAKRYQHKAPLHKEVEANNGFVQRVSSCGELAN